MRRSDRFLRVQFPVSFCALTEFWGREHTEGLSAYDLCARVNQAFAELADFGAEVSKAKKGFRA